MMPDDSTNPEGYDVEDQYVPYILAEEPSMPALRARDLLFDWKFAEPWNHYDEPQRGAVFELVKTFFFIIHT